MSKHKIHFRPWCIPALTVLLALSGIAGAASLQVAPTSVVLDPGENAEALWLSNTDPQAPVRAQVRLYRWTQENGEDKLEPTRDLAISPPMVELAAGARQLVRVVRTGASPEGAEASYRIIVDEVPPADGEAQSGLQFLLRYSLPVFVTPTDANGPISHELAARMETRDGKPTLVVHNSGRQHAQLADLAWVDGGGARVELMQGLVGYVLPGQTMAWPLDQPASRFANGGGFKARINGEAAEQSLALAAPGR